MSFSLSIYAKTFTYNDITSNSSRPFDVLHADIWRPYSTPSTHNHYFFLTLVDDYTRFTGVILMTQKSETRKHLTNFISFIKNQFSTTIKCLHSDNGQEFLMHDFYKTNRILHQRTCVECPQQNGIVERKHQLILSVARSLFFQVNLPKSFWHFSITRATHLINRLP